MALMKTSIFALLGLAALSVGLVLNFVIPGIRYYVWIMLALGAALLAVAFIFDFIRVQNTLISPVKVWSWYNGGNFSFFWCHSPRQRYQRGEFPPFRLHWLSPIHADLPDKRGIAGLGKASRNRDLLFANCPTTG